jgi:hypothetical protein
MLVGRQALYHWATSESFVPSFLHSFSRYSSCFPCSRGVDSIFHCSPQFKYVSSQSRKWLEFVSRGSLHVTEEKVILLMESRTVSLMISGFKFSYLFASCSVLSKLMMFKISNNPLVVFCLFVFLCLCIKQRSIYWVRDLAVVDVWIVAQRFWLLFGPSLRAQIYFAFSSGPLVTGWFRWACVTSA